MRFGYVFQRKENGIPRICRQTFHNEQRSLVAQQFAGGAIHHHLPAMVDGGEQGEQRRAVF